MVLLSHGSLKLLLINVFSLRSYFNCLMPQRRLDGQLDQTSILHAMRPAPL